MQPCRAFARGQTHVATFPGLNPRRRPSLSRSAAFHLGQPLQVISSAYLRLKSSRIPFHVPTTHWAGRRAGYPLYVAADYDRTDMKLEAWPGTKPKGIGKRTPSSRDETLSNNPLCFHASTLSHCEDTLRHGCQMLCVSCGGKERRLPQTTALFWSSLKPRGGSSARGTPGIVERHNERAATAGCFGISYRCCS
jgi:hypothetical protein